MFAGGSETFIERGDISFPAGPGAPRKPKAIAKVEPTPTQEPAPVSIHKSILKTIGQIGVARATSKIVPGAIVAAAGRVLPGLSRAATAGSIGAGAASLFGVGGSAQGGACQSGFHLAKDGSGRCVRNRRMNFGNARAARRSVRRLKGARKLLKDIEKMMPSRPRARARAPAGHSAHLHHTGG